MKSKNGFTLVELLVVISIIALLLAVLMPALNKVRDQGRTVACASNLRTMGQLLQIYATSSKQCVPPPFYGWGQNPPQNWYAGLLAYNLARKDTDTGGAAGGSKIKDFFSCAACNPTTENPDSTANKLGYGISLGMNDGWTNIDDPTQSPPNVPGDWWLQPVNLMSVKKASNTVLGSDVRARWVIYTWRYMAFDPITRKTSGSYVIRHKKKGSNFLMVDGHVEYADADPGQITKRQTICRPKRFKYDYDNMPK